MTAPAVPPERESPDLTDAEWSALFKAARGETLTPEERDAVRGGAGRPRLVSCTWAGGLRPDYQSITHHGRAYLAELDRIAGELHPNVMAQLPWVCRDGGAWCGDMWAVLPRHGLATASSDDECQLTSTPLGRAVLQRVKERGR